MPLSFGKLVSEILILGKLSKPIFHWRFSLEHILGNDSTGRALNLSKCYRIYVMKVYCDVILCLLLAII